MEDFMKKPVVIGGASVDLKGRPDGKLVFHTSNRGSLEKSTGGVAFNIALSLARLGIPPHFITLRGDDPEGRYIEEMCKKGGITTNHVIIAEDEKTAVYHAILDEKGELSVGIAAMKIYDSLTPSRIMPFEPLIREAPLVVADANPPAETLHYLSRLCREYNVPLFIEPTAADKCCKIFPSLEGVTYLSPNLEELEALHGKPMGSYEELLAAARHLVEKGIGQVFVTLGREGVLWVNAEGSLHRNTVEIEAKDVTGAGDAFVSGIVWALLHEISLRDALSYGIAASILTIQVYESVHPDLSPELLKTLRNEYIIHEKRISV
jgi:pseudouridine kinase